jgi:protein transport protein SEC24
MLVKKGTQDLIICPQIDKDRVFVYELERQDGASVPPERRQLIRDQTHLYLQSALLYSTAEGERRIRVHNACIPLTNIRHLPYDHLDPTAIALYYSRMGLSKV